MSLIREEHPSITVKKKNSQFIIEYCIENKIDFTLKSKSELSDEFTLEFIITSTNKAIALGMCLKELKIELNGLYVVPIATIKASKKALTNGVGGLPNGEAILADNEIKLAFENDLQFDLGSTN